MKLSLISVVMNESESINICSQQWAMAAYMEDIEFEVIIVDNGSDEEHIKNYDQLIRWSDFPVKVLNYPKPGHVIPARVKGFEESTGDYVMFPDAHVLFLPGSFDSSIKMLEEDDRLGAICMLHNQLGITPIDGEFIGGMEKCYEEDKPVKLFDKPKKIFLSGLSGTMMHRKWFEEIGRLFPEVFSQIAGGFCADEDLLCTLTWLFGKKVKNNPKSAYWHLLYKVNSDHGKVKALTDSLLVAHFLKNGDDPQWWKWVTDWRGEVDPELLKKIPIVAKEAREYIKENSKWEYRDLFQNWEAVKNA